MNNAINNRQNNISGASAEDDDVISSLGKVLSSVNLQAQDELSGSQHNGGGGYGAAPGGYVPRNSWSGVGMPGSSGPSPSG
jgi:hypothetical protein